MARVYTVSFENVSVSAAQDFFELNPADDHPIKLMAIEISNVGGTADAGDAQEELLRLAIRRLPATVTSGSGGSAPTPRPVDSGDSAASFTAEVNNTTQASTSGTAVTLKATGFNVRVGYLYQFLPEEQYRAHQGEAIIIEIDTAPADAISLSGTVTVSED